MDRGVRVYGILDRDLCNEKLRVLFIDARVKVLGCVGFFDHHRIFVSLKDNGRINVPRVFNFECAWVLEDSHESMIKKAYTDNSSLVPNLTRVKKHEWCEKLTKKEHFDEKNIWNSKIHTGRERSQWS